MCFVHGPVKSYEVHFRDVEGGSTDLMHNITVLTGEERRLDFTNLEIYWMYGVSIKAFTILGGGPLSSEITGMTDEWGNLHHFINSFSLICTCFVVLLAWPILKKKMQILIKRLLRDFN